MNLGLWIIIGKILISLVVLGVLLLVVRRWRSLPRLKFLFQTLFKVILSLYLLLCLVLLLGQRYLIFRPTPDLVRTPAVHGLYYEDVWIPIKRPFREPERLHGWWMPNPDATLGTLVYFHGNGFNVSTNVTQSYRLNQIGFSVLLVDYRGYGRSEGGYPSESSVYRDAEAAWNYLIAERAIAPRDIIIYGHSLGGAVAVDLAVRHPNAGGAIVQGSFTSMTDIVRLHPRSRFVPVGVLLTEKFNSIDKVKAIEIPVLFVHGLDDPLIPASMSEKLYAAASEPKQLLLVPDAGHNNGDRFDREEFYRAILDLVDAVNR
ncbi:alpha/beta hydrolase [Baaleninema simplex]|uniref:alpha/beta hydrolase n=1 Tax=Baaleninema simplex TaxID=2862350 RepID=UPI001FE0BC2B|nr:alpha/beta fold hydrolase [Baaleninema simplex]